MFFRSDGDDGLGEAVGSRGAGGLHHRGDPRPHGLLIHETLSLSALWVTVFFAIVPVAPLALVLLQAGSRCAQRTTMRISSRPDAALNGAASPVAATA